MDTLVDWRMTVDLVSVLGPILYWQECLNVEGTAVKSSELDLAH
jgi:hypothetical protein